jgi:transposase
LLVRNERPLAQVARELGVHENVLRKWKAAVAQGSPTGHGTGFGHFTLEEENRRLRSELVRAREERDILKKATAFFARESR